VKGEYATCGLPFMLQMLVGMKLGTIMVVGTMNMPIVDLQNLVIFLNSLPFTTEKGESITHNEICWIWFSVSHFSSDNQTASTCNSLQKSYKKQLLYMVDLHENAKLSFQSFPLDQISREDNFIVSPAATSWKI